MSWRFAGETAREPVGAAPAGDFYSLLASALQMVPLYLYYIDDHITRLESLDRRDLADTYREWRKRLID